MTLREENKRNSFGVEMIAKAKKSCVAYREPPPRVPGQKGRPRLKGECVKVATLFETMKSAFVPARIEMYGKLQDICFYCIDLLWEKKLYQPLRFVLVKMGATNSILVSTRLDLDPETIIRLYSYRFRIETMFRELKQQIGGFAYRFWTKSLAKLNHFRKKQNHPLWPPSRWKKIGATFFVLSVPLRCTHWLQALPWESCKPFH